MRTIALFRGGTVYSSLLWSDSPASTKGCYRILLGKPYAIQDGKSSMAFNEDVETAPVFPKRNCRATVTNSRDHASSQEDEAGMQPTRKVSFFQHMLSCSRIDIRRNQHRRQMDSRTDGPMDGLDSLDIYRIISDMSDRIDWRDMVQ